MTAETTEASEMPVGAENTTSSDAAVSFDPTVDEATVKFLPEKKDDAGGAVEVDAERGSPQRAREEFTGLTKEELQKYANDPYWVKVRYVLFALFIIIWIAILVAAVLIVVFSPKCPPIPDQEWHQQEVIYNIYPASFQDTNPEGDADDPSYGYGDIQGIIKHLDYFEKLDVKALWLSSVYNSSNKNGGQDILDHKAIDSRYGTLDDLIMLIKLMHKKGMKLLMDFIPNHTSDEHQWFVESAKGGADNAFANYYVWSDPASDGTSPPNNWLEVNVGGSAWNKSDGRDQFYLHQMHESEPDLNLRNENVQRELMDILTYWLDLGVDGFVVRNAEHLVEDENLRDEPASGQGSAGDYISLVHDHTTNQPENFPLVYQWQELLDNVSAKSEKYRVLLVDAGNSAHAVQYMGTNETEGAAFTINRNLLTMTGATNGTTIKELVSDWLEMMEPDRWTTWLLCDDQDTSRVATRMGRVNVNIANMLQLLLPGTAVVYYGSEIGMDDGPTYLDEDHKKVNEYIYHMPMLWDGSFNAGFSTTETLPKAAKEDLLHSVQAQRSAGNGQSSLEIFEELTRLRRNPSFLWGDLIWNVIDEGVVSFVRKAEGFSGYLVILNFGNVRRLLECHSRDPTNVPEEGEVVATSANFQHDDFEIGFRLKLDKLVLGPSQGVVFKFDLEY